MLSYEMQMKQLSKDFQAARIHEARMHRLSKKNGLSNNQGNLVRRLSQTLFNHVKNLRPSHPATVGEQQPLTS